MAPRASSPTRVLAALLCSAYSTATRSVSKQSTEQPSRGTLPEGLARPQGSCFPAACVAFAAVLPPCARVMDTKEAKVIPFV